MNVPSLNCLVISMNDDNQRYNLREVYVDTLCQLAQEQDHIVALDADSKEATLLNRFARQFPNRTFSFGIAEQNMVSAAAGMATIGLTPFVHTYALFLAMRALDQVRNSVAYPNLNVKLVVSHFGLDVGADGVTHQIIEDLAIMRAIPNMVVISPADDIEMASALKFMLQHRGPVYLRTGKSKVPRVHDSSYAFELGKPSVLREGHDVTIFAVGVMVGHAVRAAETLLRKGVSVQLVNCATLKPIHEKSVIESALKTGAVVTVEDHNGYGGLGGAISEILGRNCPLPIEMVSVKDQFAEAGTPEQLYERYGLSEAHIVQAVSRVVQRKQSRGTC